MKRAAGKTELTVVRPAAITVYRQRRAAGEGPHFVTAKILCPTTNRTFGAEWSPGFDGRPMPFVSCRHCGEEHQPINTPATTTFFNGKICTRVTALQASSIMACLSKKIASAPALYFRDSKGRAVRTLPDRSVKIGDC